MQFGPMPTPPDITVEDRFATVTQSTNFRPIRPRHLARRCASHAFVEVPVIAAAAGRLRRPQSATAADAHSRASLAPATQALERSLPLVRHEPAAASRRLARASSARQDHRAGGRVSGLPFSRPQIRQTDSAWADRPVGCCQQHAPEGRKCRSKECWKGAEVSPHS